MRHGSIAIVLAATFVAGCGPTDDRQQPSEARIKAKIEQLRTEYQRDRTAIHADFEKLFSEGQYEAARKRVASYQVAGGPEIKEFIKRVDEQIRAARERELLAKSAAREQELLAKIKASKPTDYHSLIQYYAELEKLAPGNPTYAKQWKQHRAALDKQIEVDRKKLLAADKAKRRREGVTVGMTKEEVLMSSWGRPQHINTTTTARGTREQWVYSGGYLYFDDGVLTAVQN